jgi:biotin transport system substrate-specific component
MPNPQSVTLNPQAKTRNKRPMDPIQNLRMTIIAALMAALIAAGAFLVIPIGPVPIVLQNLFVLVTGLLLAPRWAAAAIGVYLLAGCLGLPVFAGGTGGIGRLLGPTGGYLVGYVPAVMLISEANRRFGCRMRVDLSAMIVATLIVYTFGVSWLKAVTAMTWSQALAAGMLPFLPGDGIKIAAALPIARTLRPIVNRGAEALSV